MAIENRGRTGADRGHSDKALRQLTLLMLAGLACSLVIGVCLAFASYQAVAMIDNLVRARETVQVARSIANMPGGINEITLDAMSNTLDLEGARLTRTIDVGPGELAVRLDPGSDRVVAWTPHLFGAETFETVAPVRIAIGLVFVLVVGLIGWRMKAVGWRIDRRRAAATQLALTDTLTGLGNRRAFDSGLENRCADAAEGAPGFVLVMLDLDDFKSINDALGHSAGDAVLQIVAGHLQDSAGADDLVVRVGGDEFAVVRRASGLDDYLAQLEQRLAQPIVVNGRRLRVAASIGMARSDDFPGAPGRLVQAADTALYRAKRNGPGHAELAIPARRAA